MSSTANKIERLDNVKKHLYNLVKGLDMMLDSSYVDYDISYNNSEFKFKQPIYESDKKELKKQRNLLIKWMLRDALDQYLDEVIYDECDDYDKCSHGSWNDVNALLRSYVTPEQIQTPIASEVYKAAHERAQGSEKKQIDLNYDSWAVKVQDGKIYGDDDVTVEDL